MTAQAQFNMNMPFKMTKEGSHRSYIKEGVLRPVVIPTYTEVLTHIIKSNMRTAEMTRKRYFEPLAEC